MKKNKTYKRFDSDTYRRVMSILIYLESLEVKDIVRHVNHSKVYYRVRIDASFLKLDSVSNIMENLPKRYVVSFDTFMGKVFKRVMRRVHTFYRDDYYDINFLMDYLQANSYIVPIGLEDIECVRMYAENNKYDKEDVLKLVDSLLAKKSEVENILDDTEVVNKNTTLDTERLGKNFTYLKETLLRLVTNMLFTIFYEINAKDIKTVSIGVEDFKDYSKLSFIVKTYDGRVETYPLFINNTFSYAVYSLFHEDSGYQIYDTTLKEVYDIISEVRDMMVSSFNFIDFDEDIFNVVDSLRKLSVIVNSCDKKEGEKMKVVHTKETKLVRSNESRNLMLAKDLALEFIDSGYDVIMRDGDDLVVYSNTDTSMQEYVPKSLHNVFYDVDKLDLLPLSYYVYMCK